MAAYKLRSLLMVAALLALAAGLCSRAQAQDPKGPAVTPLEGTSWQGQETLAGYGDLTFRFHEDGFATMVDADGETLGVWRQSGVAVTLVFNNGNVVYRGTITGDGMGGVVRNSRSVWRWQVTRE